MYIFVCFLGSQTVYFNDFQTFNLTCASGTITIEDARWYAQKDWNVGASVTAAVQRLCASSGVANSCGSIMVAPGANQLGNDPCFGIFKTLSVQYHCSPTTSTSYVTTSDGYLVNLNCGNQQMHIDSALYYASSNPTCCNDVTASVKSQCQTNTTINGCWNVAASSQLTKTGTDPYPGQAKQLQVQFHCTPTYAISTVYFVDGVPFTLACPTQQTIVIDYARFYAADNINCGQVVT